MSQDDDDRSHNIGAFSVVIIALSILSTTLRILSRRLTKGGIGPDDYCFLIGAVIAIGLFVVSVISSFDAGLGSHWATLSQPQRVLFLKLNYAYNILNVACYPIIKVSILLLYRRVFPTRRFQQVNWLIIIFVSLYWASITLVAIFACWPPQAFYDSFGKAQHCINDGDFYWAQASINIVTDVFVTVLPIPVVWSLQMSFKRRIGLIALFGLGVLTLAVSALRIVFYLRYDPTDPTYSFTAVAYANPAEVCLAMVIACAATWRPLFERLVSLDASIFMRINSNQREYCQDMDATRLPRTTRQLAESRDDEESL